MLLFFLEFEEKPLKNLIMFQIMNQILILHHLLKNKEIHYGMILLLYGHQLYHHQLIYNIKEY